MINIDKYVAILKTKYNDDTTEIGSGVIFPLPECDYDYLITALHCIKGRDFNSERENLEIEIKDEEGNVCYKSIVDKLENILFKESADERTEDFAIIKTDKVKGLDPIFITKPKPNKEILISSYPSTKYKNGTRDILSKEEGIIKNRIEAGKLFYLKMNNGVMNFTKKANSKMGGASGAGIFQKEEGRNVLAGILTEVGSIENEHNELLGLNIEGVNEFLKEKQEKELEVYKKMGLMDKEFYVERKEKDSLIDNLKKNNVLLLTGVPFCGKTYLAKDIAERYIEEEFEIKITNEITGNEGARNFLENNKCPNKLVILEDPFGAVEKKENTENIKKGIIDLINLSSGSKKVIITTRKDILIESLIKEDISDCGIVGNKWVNLDIVELNISLEYWIKIYGDNETSRKILDNIQRELEKKSDDSILQIGHIRNINGRYKNIDDLEKMEIEDIIKEARIDSECIKNLINNMPDEMVKLFCGLTLIGNSINSIKIQELAFVLYNEENYDNEVNYNNKSSGFSIGKFKEEEIIFPEYKGEYTLSKNDDDNLDILEDKGLITINDEDEIVFRHPIHHYAGILLIQERLEKRRDKLALIKMIGNSLSIISRRAVYNSLICIETFLGKGKRKEEVKDLAFRKLFSIFPLVKNKTIEIFDKHLNLLNDEEVSNFFIEVKKELLFRDDIVWRNGEPYYDTRKNKNFFGSRKTKKTVESIDKNSDEYYWNGIENYYSELPSKEFLYSCLNSYEIFIKSKALHDLFDGYPEEFDKLKKLIHTDDNFQIIHSVIKGSLFSWFKYKEHERKEIKEFIIKSMKINSATLACTAFLQKFEREHDNKYIRWERYGDVEKKELWELWADIFLEFSKNYHIENNVFYEVHLFTTIDYMIPYVDEKKIGLVATAWFDWIKKTSGKIFLSDYAYSLINFIFKGMKNKSEERRGLLDDILSSENTSLVCSAIKSTLMYWKDLSNEEKNNIYKILRTNRMDVNWLKATSIVYDKEYELLKETFEIDSEIIANEEMLYSKIKELGILDEVISVINGVPGQIHNILGSSASRSNRWEKINMEVIKNENDGMAFKISLEHIVSRFYNKNYSDFLNYKSYIELIKDNDKRPQIFEGLLYITCVDNQNHKKMWDDYFNYVNMAEKESSLLQITNYIEAIQYQRSGEDLLEVFEKDIIRIIINNSKNDKTLYEYLDLINEIIKTGVEVPNAFIELIIKYYEMEPPRVTLVNNYTKIILEKLNYTKLNFIENRRKELINTGSEVEKKIKKEYNCTIKLTNWIF